MIHFSVYQVSVQNLIAVLSQIPVLKRKKTAIEEKKIILAVKILKHQKQQRAKHVIPGNALLNAVMVTNAVAKSIVMINGIQDNPIL